MVIKLSDQSSAKDNEVEFYGEAGDKEVLESDEQDEDVEFINQDVRASRHEFNDGPGDGDMSMGNS